jgi:class 3 adenylate cyclase/tetratricopeptide (TPR) repeat protein
VTVCAACGRENPPDGRFCSACGATLEADDRAGETRKIVTVLFTDLVDSTPLGERLDPETLRLVMARYFAAMQTTLQRHGGTVEKFIGDAVMAVFGIPTLHEDDALRAVRAGIDMRSALARLNDELEPEHGVRLSTRTGVNTGRVVAGGSSGQQKFATGDAVNVAARFEQAAKPGEILIGEETERLVRHAIRLEAVDPLTLKGKSEPLPAWRALDVLPDLPAFTLPIAAPFVGRTHELEQLQDAFRQAAAQRTCTLATIVGPPGIGKSRLARELIQALGADAHVVVGRCLPYGDGITYAPLAEIVRQVGKVEELVAEDDQAAAISARIAGAIGATETAGSPEEIAWAFRKLFELLARRRPLLIVIDDIHWAEPTLLDLIEYFASFSTGARILVLCTARPDLFDTRANWAAPRADARVLALAPLADDQTQRLIQELLQDRALSDDARARIADAAEGNPLFVEQILALQAEEPEREVEVPPTIQALLAARIDRLEPDERAVLVRGSVEGRLFHRGAVAELLPDGPVRAGVGAQLMSLVRKEFLRPDRSLFPGDDGFRFDHILIRDAAYGSMPKQLRAELHELYADWLELRVDGNLEYEEFLGHHLEQAYHLRAELGQTDDHARAVGARAGQLLAQAGSRATTRGDVRAGARLLQRAVDILGGDRTAPADVLTEYGAALNASGDLDGALRTLDDAIELARKAGDEFTQIRAEVERGWVLIGRGAEGSALEARAAAERAIAFFEQRRDDGELAAALILLGVVEGLQWNDAAAIAAHRRAREHAVAAGDDRQQVEIWNELGGAMLMSRTPVEEVLAFLDEEKQWAREKGFPFLEADAALGGPYLYPMLGRFEEGRELCARAKAIFEELGAMYNVAEACWAGAQLELLAGDAAAAERELRQALDIHVQGSAKRYSALVRALLARAVHLQGRQAEAHELLDQAAEDGTPENLTFQRLWLTAHAQLLAARGQTMEAARLAREAVDIVASTDRINSHADALVDLADILRANEEEDGSKAALEQALELYEEKGNVLCADRVRMALRSGLAWEPSASVDD